VYTFFPATTVEEIVEKVRRVNKESIERNRDFVPETHIIYRCSTCERYVVVVFALTEEDRDKMMELYYGILVGASKAAPGCFWCGSPMTFYGYGVSTIGWVVPADSEEEALDLWERWKGKIKDHPRAQRVYTNLFVTRDVERYYGRVFRVEEDRVVWGEEHEFDKVRGRFYVPLEELIPEKEYVG